MKSSSWKRKRKGNVAGLASAATLFLSLVLSSSQTARAQETKEKVTVDDVDRTYVLRLPRGYDPQQHYPVVIVLHGMNQDTDDIERLTRFDELADKDSIIVVYPAALHGRWNVGVRAEAPRARMGPGPGRRRGGYGGGGYPGGGGGYPGSGGGYPQGGGNYPQGGGQNSPEEDRKPTNADDIAFFNSMLDKIESKASIDVSRVYAAGLSEGGFMTLRVGCAMGDRIAGIAAVGAAMPKTMICLPTRPVPIIMLNGTEDPIVPHGGGTEHNLELKTISVDDSAKAWARIDRCSEKPAESKLPSYGKGGMETKVYTYDGCQQGAQVALYDIKGGGNTWPGGEQYEVENQIGKTSQDLNADETIWSFLVTKKNPTATGPEKSTTDSAPAVK
jgi:polyhydroxybutyrate depolymerase